MEKNKQILEFADIIEDVCPCWDYNMLRNLFIEYMEYVGMSWQTYTNTKTKKEILEEFKHFSLYYYLPF